MSSLADAAGGNPPQPGQKKPPEIVETRWRGLISVEFVTKAYQGRDEEEVARRELRLLGEGARRAERDVNVPAPVAIYPINAVRA